MTPKEECEVLLESLLSVTQNLLKKNGEFYPIGAVLQNDSKPAFTAVQSANEYPDSQTIILALIDKHRQKAQENGIKASGIVWNGTVTADGKQTDAIVVSLEHKDGYSVVVGLPYKKSLLKKIKFGEMFANSGNHNVF